MKKIFIFMLTVAAAAFTLQARNVHFGFEGGFGISSPHGCSGSGIAYSAAARVEYNFSSLSKGWYVASGVGIYGKGWENDIEIAHYQAERTATAAYLQLPLMAGYRMQLSSTLSLMIETGPYAAIAVAGSYEDKTYHGANPYIIHSGDCFGNDAPYRRADIGWTAGVGLTIASRWLVGLKLARQFNSFDPEEKKSNFTYGLSLGCIF